MRTKGHILVHLQNLVQFVCLFFLTEKSCRKGKGIEKTVYHPQGRNLHFYFKDKTHVKMFFLFFLNSNLPRTRNNYIRITGHDLVSNLKEM